MIRLPTLLYVVVLVAALVGPAVVWDGGCLDLEALSFITNYTADRPLLAKIFDPHLNDFDAYQARELSYLIDVLDAEVYAWTSRVLDVHLLIPLSAVVASLLLVAVLVSGARRTLANVGAVPGALLAGCLVSSFQFMSTMGIYYRSGKPLLAVVVLAFLFHVRHVSRKRRPVLAMRSGAFLNVDCWIAIGLSLLAGLLDRQGVFYVVLACGIFGLHFWLTGEFGDLFISVGLAGLGLVTYDMLIAPLVIQSVNGYWPDFSYQAIPIGRGSLLFHPRPLLLAFNLLTENVGVLLGGFRWAGVLVVAAAALGTWRWLADRSWRAWLCHGLLVFLAQVLMFGLMIQRHTPIDEFVDHRFWYYPLPFLATVLFALGVGLDAALANSTVNGRRLVVGALLLVTVSNVVNLGRNKDLMTSGPWFARVYVQSTLFKSSLRHGIADPRLDVDYRAFFERDRAFGTR